jgi:hypothetical protein
MSPEVRAFVARVANSIVKLEVVLFYQANSATSDTPEGISLRTHWHVDEVRPALQELAGAGVLEEHALGAGRYTVYCLTKDTQTRALLAELSETYHERGTDCRAIIRMLKPPPSAPTNPNALASQEKGSHDEQHGQQWHPRA